MNRIYTLCRRRRIGYSRRGWRAPRLPRLFGVDRTDCYLRGVMRPLARKIVLTQGVIILLIFGVSLFTWWQMVDASNRAERLQAEYHLGTNLEQLVAELRDMGRSRTYYFGEKKSGGEELARLQDSFYLSLVRIASTIDELALQSGPRADLAGLVDTLRRRLDEYQLRVGQQELAFLRDEELAYQRSGARAAELRQDMHDKTKDHLQRQAAMTREINALGRRADRAAVLALVFCGVALVVGLLAAYGLTRSIHRPVRDMRAATEALSRGEFDSRIPVHSRDELGDLALAFNEMAARLQELDELKGGFVSMVSHDLKTPLTSMKEAVEMLSEGVGGDLTVRQKRLLTIASESLDRLGRYVQGILDLCQFEGGRIQLVREPLSLTDVVQEQASLAEARCQEAGVNLHCELEQDLPLLEGDRFRLAQVVNNLLDNAIKFTPREGRIEVRTGVLPWEDDLGVFLEVSDSGVGIAARDLRHIFEKFYQAPSDSRGKVRGAGLGLAIVRNLVEAHSGRVTVESTMGRGTTFRVQFPAARRQADDQALAG
ncbi:MAG: HAMP domain-containing sensor histidine kinase [Acidobacteria bacterium]|nr:HAMP domain-containing sensor histidine kinase [Acidobacteriota bacterium]